MKALTTLLVIGMFATAVAMADDVDDVKAAVQGDFGSRNSGDAYAYAQSFLEGFTRFGFGGQLLEQVDSLEELRKDRQASFDAGVKFNLQDRHTDVSLYGNSTAVVTSYRVGTMTVPDGRTVRINNRITTVLVKQGGQWKIAHVHDSPLRGPQ